MNNLILLKSSLEEEEKTLLFLIKHGDGSIKLLRETLLQKTKEELLSVKNELMVKCNHDIIHDYIDIGERSMQIKYCNICGLTLR